nr:hypothetical protein [Arsukibacterium sp.]
MARVLLAPTAVVLLDEPTASLDNQSRDIVINVLQRAKAENHADYRQPRPGA